MSHDPIHLLLVDFGSPDNPHNLEELRPFLARIFGDPMNEIFGKSRLLNHVGGAIMARCLAKRSRDRYASVRYPLPPRTLMEKLAADVQGALQKTTPGRFTVSWAMRYNSPLIESVLPKLTTNGHSRIVIIPLFPHNSRATVGSIKQVCDEAGGSFRFVESWHLHPTFIHAWTTAIRERLEIFPEQERKNVFLLYSAHAIPVDFIERYHDPYVRETEATACAVTKALGLGNPMAVGFQSRLNIKRWTGPDSTELIGQLAAKGIKHCLVVPISFLFEHIETLYDVDRLIVPAGRQAGITHCERAYPPGPTAAIAQTLAEIGLREAKEWL